jgi:hypothetical protein
MITWYLIALDWWLIWLRPVHVWVDRDDHPSGGGGGGGGRSGATVVDLARWRHDHSRRAA